MNLLLLWFLNYFFFNLNALPQIKLPQGLIDGKLMLSESGQKYFAFFGIPYALPPVGPLRFKVSLFYSIKFYLLGFQLILSFSLLYLI